MKKLIFIHFLALLQFNVFAQSIQEQKWNNSSCGTLGFFEDSLLLHIQENSFFLENDNSDEVTITVKLFANYYDMLMDKIQMKDQNGIYVSGGMYDIQISSNGKEVRFQKEIKVSYISDGIEHYNGFQFDPKNKTWKQLNTPVLDYASTNSTGKEWGTLQPRVNVEEEEMSDEFDDWGWAMSPVESQWLYKTMNIKGNGLYNYDYLIEKEVLVTYQLKIENKDIDKLYVYYPHLNTVIYYTINSENEVEDFSLVDTELSNVRLFTFDPLKENNKVKIGELEKGALLNFSKTKLNSIKFQTSIHPLSKAVLDQKFASI